MVFRKITFQDVLNILVTVEISSKWKHRRLLKTHQCHNPAGGAAEFLTLHGTFQFPFRNVFSVLIFESRYMCIFQHFEEKIPAFAFCGKYLLFTEGRIWLHVWEHCYSILWKIYFSFPILLRSGFPAEDSLPSHSLRNYNSPS